MAIGTGSGQLKYPLPILQTQQQANAASASAGGSASASAYGANRSYAANKMRVMADLANSAMDRQQRAYEADMQRGFSAGQAYLDRQQQLDLQANQQQFAADQQGKVFQQQKDLQTSSQTFQGSQTEKQQAFQADQAEKDRQFQTQNRDQQIAEQDALIQAGLDSGTHELPPGAQRELDKIAQGRAEVNDGKHTPAQIAEFEQQAQTRERALKRTARPVQDPNAGVKHWDPQQNQYVPKPGPGTISGTIGPNGQFTPIMDTSTKDAEQQAQQKADAAAQQTYTKELHNEAGKIMAEKNADGDPAYANFDEALAEAKRRRGLSGYGAPGGSESPPVPNPQPAPAPAGAPPVPLPPPDAAVPPGVTTGPMQTGGAPMSAETFNQQWATLKPGQIIYGPDGKRYKKP